LLREWVVVVMEIGAVVIQAVSPSDSSLMVMGMLFLAFLLQEIRYLIKHFNLLYLSFVTVMYPLVHSSGTMH
jgi:hypothetical protein